MESNPMKLLKTVWAISSSVPLFTFWLFYEILVLKDAILIVFFFTLWTIVAFKGQITKIYLGLAVFGISIGLVFFLYATVTQCPVLKKKVKDYVTDVEKGNLMENMAAFTFHVPQDLMVCVEKLEGDQNNSVEIIPPGKFLFTNPGKYRIKIIFEGRDYFIPSVNTFLQLEKGMIYSLVIDAQVSQLFYYRLLNTTFDKVVLENRFAVHNVPSEEDDNEHPKRHPKIEPYPPAPIPPPGYPGSFDSERKPQRGSDIKKHDQYAVKSGNLGTQYGF